MSVIFKLENTCNAGPPGAPDKVVQNLYFYGYIAGGIVLFIAFVLGITCAAVRMRSQENSMNKFLASGSSGNSGA